MLQIYRLVSHEYGNSYISTKIGETKGHLSIFIHHFNICIITNSENKEQARNCEAIRNQSQFRRSHSGCSTKYAVLKNFAMFEDLLERQSPSGFDLTLFIKFNGFYYAITLLSECLLSQVFIKRRQKVRPAR